MRFLRDKDLRIGKIDFNRLKNKYIITTLIFLVWIAFFDENNWVERAQNLRELRELRNDKEYYIEQIETDTERLKELKTNDENLEKYARLAKKMGVNFIRVLEPRAVGNFSNQKVQLDSSQLKMLNHYLVKMNSYPEYKDYPVVIFFGYHQRNLGCMGSGNRYLYIDANGEVHACPFCRGSVGNINSIPLNNAIEKLQEKGCQMFKMY